MRAASCSSRMVLGPARSYGWVTQADTIRLGKYYVAMSYLIESRPPAPDNLVYYDSGPDCREYLLQVAKRVLVTRKGCLAIKRATLALAAAGTTYRIP